MSHGGERLETSPFSLAHVDDAIWNDSDDLKRSVNRKNVLEQLQKTNKSVGHDVWAYEAINTFEEDAMRCWRDHHRPEEGKPCIDFWDDSKRIGRPTEMGRAFVRDRDYHKLAKKDPHLCAWCPYFSVVVTERRWKRGMYKTS